MSDALRQASEQFQNKIEALERQIGDAEANIKTWKAELEDVKAAKAHVDSKLPKAPVKNAVIQS